MVRTDAVRAAAGRLARSGIEVAQVFDPSRLALPPRRGYGGEIAFIAVYRARHAQRLRRLLQDLDHSVTVRLWCLNEPPEHMYELTEGHGPGTRFTLLNRLVETIPPSRRRDGLVISDDDYSFRVGNLTQLVKAGRALGLDAWQPAHSASSWVSYPFVRRRIGTVLRRTTFVEQGPLLVLSKRAQEVFLPLPEDLGMGWGAEVRWSSVFANRQLNLGIVDALATRHLPADDGYDRNAQRRQLSEILEEAGIESLEQLQREYSRLGPWKGRQLLHSELKRLYP